MLVRKIKLARLRIGRGRAGIKRLPWRLLQETKQGACRQRYSCRSESGKAWKGDEFCVTDERVSLRGRQWYKAGAIMQGSNKSGVQPNHIRSRQDLQGWRDRLVRRHERSRLRGQQSVAQLGGNSGKVLFFELQRRWQKFQGQLWSKLSQAGRSSSVGHDRTCDILIRGGQ